MVRCVVLKCPLCGQQRPYPVENPDAPLIQMRIKELGFGEHGIVAHGDTPEEEFREKVWEDREVMDVDESLVSRVEDKQKKKKWGNYGLDP